MQAVQHAPHEEQQHRSLATHHEVPRQRLHQRTLFEVPAHHSHSPAALLGLHRDDLVFVGVAPESQAANDSSSGSNGSNITTTLPYSGPAGPPGPVGPAGDESVKITMGITRIRLGALGLVGILSVLIYAKVVHSSFLQIKAPGGGDPARAGS